MNLATQVAFLLNRALRAFQGQNRACLSFMIGMATSIPTGERIFITANGLKFSLFPGWAVHRWTQPGCHPFNPATQ